MPGKELRIHHCLGEKSMRITGVGLLAIVAVAVVLILLLNYKRPKPPERSGGKP